MEALDGNSLAGALAALYGRDMTARRGTCGHCGATGPLAELHVYLRAPGSVARCPSCRQVVFVVLETRERVAIHIGGYDLVEDHR